MEFSVCLSITECIYLHNNKINKDREDIFTQWDLQMILFYLLHI